MISLEQATDDDVFIGWRTELAIFAATTPAAAAAGA